MRRLFGPIFIGAILAFCSHVSSPRAFAAAPSFAVSATNVTMPLSQSQYGSSTFTLTSVNGYTGGPQVTCAAINPPAKPNCPPAISMG